MRNRMSLIRAVLIIIGAAVIAASPMLGVLGARDAFVPVFTIEQSVTPNIVVDGDIVSYTVIVKNTGLARGEIAVTDDFGIDNRSNIHGTNGGFLVLMPGTLRVTGIDARYVTGTLESVVGVRLMNVSPEQTVVIEYNASVDGHSLGDNQYSSIRNAARLSNGVTSHTGIRILGKNVTDESVACSSPAYGVFPDPSSRAELTCYANFLTDTGRASQPPRTDEVAHELAIDTRQCTFSAVRDFRDVNAGTELQCSISIAHDLGLVAGYPDGTFRPSVPVTRAEFTKVVLQAAGGAPVAPAGATRRFSDVSASYALSPYIAAAADRGIVSGYADGTFRPNAPVRRDEATKMMLRAFGISTVQVLPADPAISDFSDMGPSDPLVAYVLTASALGIVDGSGGRFYPNHSVSRAEVTKMIVKLLGYLANGGSVSAS